MFGTYVYNLRFQTCILNFCICLILCLTFILQAAEDRVLKGANGQIGTFLIRQKTGNFGQLQFAVLESSSKVRHHVLERRAGQYIRSDGVKFLSIQDFLDEHQKNVRVFACKLSLMISANGQ